MSFLKCITAISVSCAPICVYISDKFIPWINSFTVHAQPRSRPLKRRHRNEPIRCPHNTHAWDKDQNGNLIIPRDNESNPNLRCSFIPTIPSPKIYPKPSIPIRTILEYDGFIMSYDKSKFSPCWTLEVLRGKKLKKLPDQYELRKEGRIPEAFATYDEDYIEKLDKSGLPGQRFKKMFLVHPGHHRIDVYNNPLVYTNIVPQARGQNGSLWDDLNNYIDFLLRVYANVYVCSGPLYLPESYENYTGEVERIYLGKTKDIPVPTHFFRVIVCERHDKTFRFECYKIKNNPIKGDEKFVDYKIARTSLEREAGFRLFEDIKPEMITADSIHPDFVMPRKRSQAVKPQLLLSTAGLKKMTPKESPPKHPTMSDSPEGGSSSTGIIYSPISPGELEILPSKEPSPKRQRIELSPVPGPSSWSDILDLQPRRGEVEKFLARQLSTHSSESSSDSDMEYEQSNVSLLKRTPVDIIPQSPVSSLIESKSEKTLGRNYLVPHRSSSTMKIVSSPKDSAQTSCPTSISDYALTLEKVQSKTEHSIIPRTITKSKTAEGTGFPKLISTEMRISTPLQDVFSPSKSPVPKNPSTITSRGGEYHSLPISSVLITSEEYHSIPFKSPVQKNPATTTSRGEEYHSLPISSVLITSEEYHPIPSKSPVQRNPETTTSRGEEYHSLPISSVLITSEEYHPILSKSPVQKNPETATSRGEEYHSFPISSVLITSEEYHPIPSKSPVQKNPSTHTSRGEEYHSLPISSVVITSEKYHPISLDPGIQVCPPFQAGLSPTPKFSIHKSPATITSREEHPLSVSSVIITSEEYHPIPVEPEKKCQPENLSLLIKEYHFGLSSSAISNRQMCFPAKLMSETSDPSHDKVENIWKDTSTSSSSSLTLEVPSQHSSSSIGQ